MPTAGADRLRDVFSPDGKRFLVVLVPEAGTLPHSDHHDKFPVRVGNVTAHLDAYGVVKWLSERGLLRREGQQSYPEFKREPISDLEASTITAGLNSGVAAVQIEALRDFTHLSHRHIVLDREDIASPVSRILRGGTTEEVKLIVDALRSVVLWGPDQETRPVADWFDRIAELARDVRESELARMA